MTQSDVKFPAYILNLFVLILLYRSKDYTAPVNFVSAGLRKTAAEEKQQQQQKKQAGDSDEDDGDEGEDDGPTAPSPPRGGAPKKLQMVKNTLMLLNHHYVFCNSALSKACTFLFSRVVSEGIKPRGLQVAFRVARGLVIGKSTPKALDRNFCRKWATNQAKALERMHKVGDAEYISEALGYFYEYSLSCNVDVVYNAPFSSLQVL